MSYIFISLWFWIACSLLLAITFVLIVMMKVKERRLEIAELDLIFTTEGILGQDDVLDDSVLTLVKDRRKKNKEVTSQRLNAINEVEEVAVMMHDIMPEETNPTPPVAEELTSGHTRYDRSVLSGSAPVTEPFKEILEFDKSSECDGPKKVSKKKK